VHGIITDPKTRGVFFQDIAVEKVKKSGIPFNAV
jgi:hypothetical protein